MCPKVTNMFGFHEMFLAIEVLQMQSVLMSNIVWSQELIAIFAKSSKVQICSVLFGWPLWRSYI